MRMKVCSLMVCFALCFLFLTACRSSTIPYSTSIYHSPNVDVTLIQDTDTVQFINYEWAVLTDEMAYTKNTVILTGIASNVRQATVAYEYMDTDVFDNITIFDIEVADVLACQSGSFQPGDLVTVGVGYNRNKYGEGLPVIENGTSYLIFAYVAADQEQDPLELSEYVTCWISAPKDLFLEKIGDFYLSNDYFSSALHSYLLADCLDFTEEEITALAGMSHHDISAVDAYVGEMMVLKSKEPVPEEADVALLVLKNRTMEGSAELWNLVNSSYLIRCTELEDYIRNTTLQYNK